MNNRDLIKQLKSLPKIRLSDNRRFFIKEKVFNQIERQNQEFYPVLENKIRFFDLFSKTKVAATAFVAVIFFISSIGTIAAMGAVRGSLPGDIFYPVKIAIEKTQVSLAQDKENKIKLQTEFALRRLEELEALSVDSQNPQPQEKVAEAVNNFKNEVSVVKKNLSQLNSSKSKQVQDAFGEKVVDKVGRRLAEVEKKINILTSVTEKTNNKKVEELSGKAKESFDEAKNSFLNEDLGGAIEKLVISDGIIQELVIASGSDELLKTEQ